MLWEACPALDAREYLLLWELSTKQKTLQNERSPRTPYLPLRVLVGERDAFTSDAEIAGWADYTAAGCTVDRVAGGHFFHQEQREQVVARLAAWADELTR